jgi:hypothetical protein
LDGTEHVAADDPSSDIVETASSEIIVNSGCAVFSSMHALKGASREHPFVQCHTANTKRVLKALIWTSTVAIDGNSKRVDSEFRHESSVKLRVFIICKQWNDEGVGCNLTSCATDFLKSFESVLGWRNVLKNGFRLPGLSGMDICSNWNCGLGWNPFVRKD